MTFKRAMVSPRTFGKTLEVARLHIYPEIGEMKLEDISSPVIQRIFNKKTMDGYALASVKKIKFLLNQFFEYAVESGFMESNPVAKTKLQSRERKVQTEEEYKAIPIEARKEFLEVIKKSEMLEPICMVQMFAGLRIGEALALTWKDIDFENKIINIDNAITLIPKFDKQGKRISNATVISDTKTSASIREVPIPGILIECLEKWKKDRWVRQRRTGISFIEPNDLVFSTNDGKLRTYSDTRQMFNKLLKRHGFKEYHLHFHSLRHTYSSMLFEAGENPKVIQMLLGHKDVTTTIKTYNSVDRSYFKQATDKLDEKFKPKE